MRLRILTAMVGVVVLATTVLTLPLAVVIVKRRNAEAVSELDRVAERTAALLDPGVGTLGEEVELPPNPENLLIAVYDRHGRRLVGAGPKRADSITARPGIDTTDGTIGSERVVARPVTIDEERVATVRVAEPVGETTEHIRRDLLLLAVVDLLAVGVAAAVGGVLAGLLARPLRAIRDDAVRLGEGDFGIVGRRSGVAEIDETSGALAETASRLDTVLSRERTFSANASHQLRTPVTSMRLAVESELAVPRPDPRAVFDDVLVDLDRLEATIDTLLAVARDLPQRRDPLDVEAVMARTRDRWAPLLEREGRSLAVTGEDQPGVLVSIGVLDEILDVLVDNAYRHGRGAVTVSIASTDEVHVAVTVSDEGSLRVDPALLFRRRRVGTERHGIGLALARSLAEAEGGRLILVGADPTTFRLLLPDSR